MKTKKITMYIYDDHELKNIKDLIACVLHLHPQDKDIETARKSNLFEMVIQEKYADAMQNHYKPLHRMMNVAPDQEVPKSDVDKAVEAFQNAVSYVNATKRQAIIDLDEAPNGDTVKPLFLDAIALYDAKAADFLYWCTNRTENVEA